MTSPLKISLNFECDIELPNNPHKILKIKIIKENSEEDILNWCKKGKREISLHDSLSYRLINKSTEELIIFEDIEHIGHYNREEIVQSFHNDDIEFI